MAAALPYAAHLRRNSAELVRNAHQSVDIVLLRQALKPVVKMISEGFVGLGIIAVLVVTAPLASLVAVAALLPLAGILLGVVFPRMKRLGRTNQEMDSAADWWRQVHAGGRAPGSPQANRGPDAG